MSKKNRPITCRNCGHILMKIEEWNGYISNTPKTTIIRCGNCQSDQRVIIEKIISITVEMI